MHAKIKPGFTSEDLDVAQKVAETFWRIATSNTSAIARYDSPVYKAAERFLLATLVEVYGITPHRARRVRDLLAEYGPHDSLTGTIGHGISSYVQYTLHNA